VVTYIIRRLLYSVVVLAVVSFVIFVGVSEVGDPLANLKMHPEISQVTLHHIEHEKHLDRNVVVRYGYWVDDVFTNKFGSYLVGERPIWPDLRRVLPHTLQLVIGSELLAVIVGIGIGIYSAIRQYSPFDYAATAFSFLAYAVPVFWLALLLQIAFTNIYLHYNVRIFYTSGLSSVNPGGGFHFLVDRLQHLALPVATLCLLSIAGYSRFLRASMLEVINSDYVRTARAKGLMESRVTLKHAFRNALIPLVTVMALNFGALIGGALITESIFSLDGMGPFFLNNLFQQDVYPVMAWLMITSAAIIVANLLADIALAVIDPRIRLD
jgi:peptide/nickel transport system permease protein